jgi:hypothetical protein
VGPVTGDSEDIAGLWPDVAANGEEARKLMEEHGYGPNHRLPVKVTTRNIAQYRDPAVILIDQMKQIYIDGELDTVETANWFPKIARKDSMLGANLSGSGVDDPDAYFFERFAYGSERNYTNYCNPELDTPPSRLLVVGWLRLGRDPPRVTFSRLNVLGHLVSSRSLDVLRGGILLTQVNPRLLALHCVHRSDRRRGGLINPGQPMLCRR